MRINVLPTPIIHQIFSGIGIEQRDVLGEDPTTAGLLPLIDDSRQALNNAATALTRAAAIKQLSRLAAEADSAHDTYLTVLFQLIQVEQTGVRFEGDTKDLEVLTRIVETLLPDGMSQVKKTYLQEASEAPLLFQSLTPAQKERLEAIRFGDRTALQVAKQWVSAAEILGDLVRKRHVLENSDAGDFGGPQKRSARNLALKRLSLLISALDLSTLNPGQISAIRGPIEGAVEEHERKLAQGGDEAPMAEEASTASEGGAEEPAAATVQTADSTAYVEPAPTPAAEDTSAAEVTISDPDH